jgi:hypothetical protein
MDARLVIDIVLQDVGGRIGGCVVDADNLQILERLGQDGVDAPSQRWLLVVDGDDDGKLRHGFDFRADMSSMDLKIRIPRKTCSGTRTA